MSEHDDLRERLVRWDPASDVSEEEADRHLRAARVAALERRRAETSRSLPWSRLAWAGGLALAALAIVLTLRGGAVRQPPTQSPTVPATTATTATARTTEPPAGAETLRTVLVASNGTRIYWSTSQ